MLKLPPTILQQFDILLLNQSFPDKDRVFYKKWLRFYWDFCHKYQYDAFDSSSLPLFIQKLQDKNQSVQQQNQAKQAVSLFLKMNSVSKQHLTSNINVSKPSQQVVNHTNVAFSQKAQINRPVAVVQNAVQQHSNDLTSSHSLIVNHPLENTGASWVFVFDQLVNEIKIRHYSPKTLKAYRGYIRQLQAFTASQNLAFNALLFLFKNVLKTEFGEIKGGG